MTIIDYQVPDSSQEEGEKREGGGEKNTKISLVLHLESQPLTHRWKLQKILALKGVWQMGVCGHHTHSPELQG